VIPVGSLRALAFGAARAARHQDHLVATDVPMRVMAATDARMGQVYWGLYDGGPAARQLAAAQLTAPGHLAELLARWQPHVIAGNALRALETAWPSSYEATRFPDLAVDASMVAELARIELAAGRAVAARDAAPEYVRDQVALTVAQRSTHGGPAP
jgi:tRNA threonylcarbamoyladenosine biosynthesis protein TsaB